MKLEELAAIDAEATALIKFSMEYGNNPGKGRASKAMNTTATAISRLSRQAQAEADRQEDEAAKVTRDRVADAYRRAVADTWTWVNTVKRIFWRVWYGIVGRK